jgi:GrpB-like predicted nucleotidyltransferase (UPF0157 family)
MYVYPHKQEWKAEYLQESERIRSRYGRAIDLHHIGSTAVVGLLAKDCIDILGVVSDLSEVVARKQTLIELGYRYRGENGIAGRRYFSKVVRKVHLHIFESGDPNVEKHLRFVKRMQGDEALVDELNRLKAELHERYPNERDAYQAGKSHFYSKLNPLS